MVNALTACGPQLQNALSAQGLPLTVSLALKAQNVFRAQEVQAWETRPAADAAAMMVNRLSIIVEDRPDAFHTLIKVLKAKIAGATEPDGIVQRLTSAYDSGMRN